MNLKDILQEEIQKSLKKYEGKENSPKIRYKMLSTMVRLTKRINSAYKSIKES